MRAFNFIFFLLLSLGSCNILKVAGDKNGNNVTDIGIETIYENRANNLYTDTVNAAVENVISRFNTEKHIFGVHKKGKTDKAYLTLDFSKIKIVSNGGVIAGYVISALGILVAPIAVYELSEKTFLLAFYYLPENRIEYKASLSPYLNDIKGRPQHALIQTGAMFKKMSKRINVTKTKFEVALYNMLLNLEKQLRAH